VLAKAPDADHAGYSWRVMTPRYGIADRQIVACDETFESWDERERTHPAQLARLRETGWLAELGECVSGWEENLLWVMREEAQPGDPPKYVWREDFHYRSGEGQRARELLMQGSPPELPGLTLRFLLPLSGPNGFGCFVAEWGFASFDAYFQANVAQQQTEVAKEWMAQWREISLNEGLHVMYEVRG
jgi:hypothetical protein